ncbi:hypothetical protein EVAR_18114_1 [Eumeta japonica]|uniref:Uncharacterized protein n=1 Tax=Eumeta variegata TaxID=151549 RepID=A0A4C1VK28_EUMVA|nr:hypothetical protein EVAR_18114_1 [Eumeta japonica]
MHEPKKGSSWYDQFSQLDLIDGAVVGMSNGWTDWDENFHVYSNGFLDDFKTQLDPVGGAAVGISLKAFPGRTTCTLAIKKQVVTTAPENFQRRRSQRRVAGLLGGIGCLGRWEWIDGDEGDEEYGNAVIEGSGSPELTFTGTIAIAEAVNLPARQIPAESTVRLLTPKPAGGSQSGSKPEPTSANRSKTLGKFN